MWIVDVDNSYFLSFPLAFSEKVCYYNNVIDNQFQLAGYTIVATFLLVS